MKHTIAEIKEGAQVWMYLPDLNVSHPLHVTVGSVVTDIDYMMPFRNVSFHKQTENSSILSNRSCSASSECYDTKEEAQEAINCAIRHAEEEKSRLKDFYWKIADKYFNENNIHCNTAEHAFYLGFVEACMFLRNKKYLLDINPSVSEGVVQISEILKMYMKND